MRTLLDSVLLVSHWDVSHDKHSFFFNLFSSSTTTIPRIEACQRADPTINHPVSALCVCCVLDHVRLHFGLRATWDILFSLPESTSQLYYNVLYNLRHFHSLQNDAYADRTRSMLLSHNIVYLSWFAQCQVKSIHIIIAGPESASYTRNDV